MLEIITLTDETSIRISLPDEGSVGCFMSGGADSSLLCYLLAHTIQKHGLKTKVFPISAEMLARPYNLRIVSNVLQVIEQLTGFQFSLHLCFTIPNHNSSFTDSEKELRMAQYTKEFAKAFHIQTIFNGLTANPPLDALKNTNLARRQTCRDDLQWRTEKENKKGLHVPFIHHDKRSIAELYNNFNLLNSLLPHTRSCEGERVETDDFTKDCYQVRSSGQECWWCRKGSGVKW